MPNKIETSSRQQTRCNCPVQQKPDGSVLLLCVWRNQVKARWCVAHPTDALAQARCLHPWLCPSCRIPIQAVLAEVVPAGVRGPRWIKENEGASSGDSGELLVDLRCSAPCGWTLTLNWLFSEPEEVVDSWAGLWNLDSLERTHPISVDEVEASRRQFMQELGFRTLEDDGCR
jgi:hypothetical protein